MGINTAISFYDLVSKTLVSVTTSNDEVNFHTSDGLHYRLFHRQDCCEHVYLEDVTGDVNDLVGAPIVTADQRTMDNDDSNNELACWTFYQMRTLKGDVTFRFNGSSNGYYSVVVDFGLVE